MNIQDAKLFASVVAVVKQQTKKITEDIVNHVKIIEGPIGDKGPAGEKGNKGDIGDTGPQGEQGLLGAKGDIGDTGPQGEQGPIGEQGLIGAKGDVGLRGYTGQEGKQGLKGEQGKTGPKGLKGDKGPRGIQGKSGVAGKNGKNGLRGEQGKIGLRGQAGAKGDKGTIGKAGPKGPKGDTGPAGKDGKDADNTLLRRELQQHKNFVSQSMSAAAGSGSYSILDMGDVVFSQPSELANNDILVFDNNIQKFTSLNIVDVINNIKIELEMQYDKLIDEQVDGTTTFTYIGEATPGGTANNAVWRIKRVGEYANNLTEILWAGDTDAFNKVWNNRITYTYNK